VEQRILKRRVQEAKDLELRRKLTENNILAGHGRSDIRVDGKRRARSEAAERRELFEDYQNVRAEQDQACRTQIAQFETQLADELARRKAEQLRIETDKRRVCDGSEELRALKERLHMAKVNKDRAQQLMEIGVREDMDRLREHKIAEHMEDERLECVELEHKLNIEKLKQRERVKHINQQQIVTKEARRAEALAEYLKEKDHVQELVQKLAAEDHAEMQARTKKKQETRASLQRFVVEQKAKQEAMEEAERNENESIEAFARKKREQERLLQEQKEAAEREKVKVLNAMIGQIEARNKEAEEFEHLRNDLHHEELEAEARRRDEMMVRKRLEDREDMKNAFNVQLRLREERAAKEREEEEKMRQHLMRKFAEDDRLEQMNENKRRMRAEHHKREADRLVALRREMYERERQNEAQDHHKLKEQDAQRQVIIEEERQRLLREYAVELRDFLPKHTLETEQDYQLVFGQQ